MSALMHPMPTCRRCAHGYDRHKSRGCKSCTCIEFVFAEPDPEPFHASPLDDLVARILDGQMVIEQELDFTTRTGWDRFRVSFEPSMGRAARATTEAEERAANNDSEPRY